MSHCPTHDYSDLGGQAEISSDGLEQLLEELRYTKKIADVLRQNLAAERLALQNRFEDMQAYFPEAKSWQDVCIAIDHLQDRQIRPRTVRAIQDMRRAV